jgi:hypothetical protein
MALIAAAVVVAVAAGGVGIYIHSQSRPKPRLSAPPVVSVGSTTTGSTTVGQAPSAEFLTVVTTNPGSNAVGAAVNAPITFGFNLPVDPASVKGFFSILPAVQGTFTQGAAATDVVFTPSAAFASGSPVSVVIRQGLTSRDGFALQNDFSLSFSTEVSDQGVSFLAANQVATLVNALSGRSVSITLQIGNQVPSDVALKTYKATSSDLLAALVHSTNGQYNTNPVDISSMHLVDTRSPVNNNDQVTVTQPDGIYVMVAASARGQHGAIWVDFSHYGVLLRQDDQKIVVAGQDLTVGDTGPSFTIAFYNLADRVQKVLSGTFTGTGEFAAKYPAPLDLAIASAGGEDVIIPMSAPASNADNKVIGDLSQQAQIYVTTDRAGYQKGDTVKFYGVVRLSNDQSYTVQAATTVAVWVGQSPSRLVDLKVAATPDGTFSGTFAMPAAAFSQDGTDTPMTLFAGLQSAQPNDYSLFSTVVQALGPHTPAGKITLAFDKPSYVTADTVAASIAGVDGSGKALAGKAVSVTVYSTGHQVVQHEADSFASPTAWGVAIKQNVQVTLDATGHATYSVPANAAQVSADQQLTVTATYGAGSTATLGARSVVVYQATDEVFLLASRTVYMPGEVVTAPFVVETRSGQRVPNAPIAYEFDKTDYQGTTSTTTVVGSGTTTTDANGMGVVHVAYTGPVAPVELRVKGKDAAGSAFQDVKTIFITQDPNSIFSMGAGVLVHMSVAFDKIAYSAGDMAHFTITSPAAQNVLMSLERGRIHQYRWLALAQGDTQVTQAISPDLAPGFTMTFSYFQNGAYLTEGLPILVNNSSQLLNVAVTPDKPSYSAGQTAHVTITVTDSSGKPVAATLLVDGYDAGMSSYKLDDISSIGQAFFTPAARGTNASSSLVGIGNFGGRCGGGFNQGQPAATNPGQLAVWLTGVTTDAAGRALVDVPIAKVPLRLAFIASTSTTSVGQAEADLGVQ